MTHSQARFIVNTYHIAGKLIVRIFLGLFAIITVFPFVWSAILATHDRTTMFTGGIDFSFGDKIETNYASLLSIMDFWSGMMNSVSISVIGTTISLLFCSMAGYALAVFTFRGKTAIFSVMIGSMMIPPVLTLIPYYMVISAMGLANTHVAVWLPFTINPFGIFLIRQYVVASVPKDLLEAAKLDGANALRTYWSIVLPLLRPGLATLAIVQFVFLWNNFLQPLVVLNSPEKMVITQMLRSVQGVPNTPWGAVMLGTTISILPLLAIYMTASKQMIAGLTSGAVK
ncbi:carbohydrate ABC transporter permease [Reinekea marina]|uniref:Carbohydrate ABC transporter permease n=1 Tax=Reinekea marina TaxID=1310421 RepID=A0ABV7WTL0_9GAMM|nr:carbohydrate ABC transporter permease [Reinekea marina]MBU2864057.1 carbohydrate ABC transporter permease [Reinekea forsetii]MDN3648036.1 carbohydrate ABC transporter permease [Reinekea marina]